MVNKLSCTTSLNLSLGDHGFPRNQHFDLHDHEQEQEQQEKKSTIKFERWLPSLKLGIGRDQETNPSDPINLIHKASNSIVPAVSSFLNLTSAKGQRDEGSEEKVSSKDDETTDEGGARKKLKLTKQQTFVLEKSFKQHNTLNLKQKQAVATSLDLQPRQVEVWFQNRRARTKLKQNEVECARLKKYCEGLTSENRRLEKEIQELKATITITTVPRQLYMQFRATSSHSMCTSCERIVSGSSGGGGGGGCDTAKLSKTLITRAPKSHTHLFSQLC